jgi:virginiamycin B lyase
VDLPEGAGKQILDRACVGCHNLTEVTKFRGFYTRPQWRDIVQTMVDYGAAVNNKDAEILTTYLTETLGKK